MLEFMRPRAHAALAGWQAGMFAALAMLVWLGLTSAWYRHSFWNAADIMATTFYGPAALGQGLAWSTCSGIAFYLIVYSLFGALHGWVMEGAGNRRRLMLIGMLAGGAWYYLWFGLLWMRLNPLVSLYTHDRPMLLGHLLYGALLGRFPAYLARRAASPTGAPEPVANGAPELDASQR
jgi:hypothetical protein